MLVINASKMPAHIISHLDLSSGTRIILSIEGAWATDRVYAVVHRMAFNTQSRGKHLSGEAFSLIKNFCIDNKTFSIRVDTQDENKVMQHILARENFKYCGLIQFDGGPKLAYEWDYRCDKSQF